MSGLPNNRTQSGFYHFLVYFNVVFFDRFNLDGLIVMYFNFINCYMRCESIFVVFVNSIDRS